MWAGTHKHSSTGVLDMLLRALEGGAKLSIVGELDPAGHERLLRSRPALRDAFDLLRIEPASEPSTLEMAARLVERMALVLQGSLLVRHAPPAVADAFCTSRLAGDWGHAFGTLPRGVDTRAVVARILPR